MHELSDWKSVTQLPFDQQTTTQYKVGFSDMASFLSAYPPAVIVTYLRCLTLTVQNDGCAEFGDCFYSHLLKAESFSLHVSVRRISKSMALWHHN